MVNNFENSFYQLNQFLKRIILKKTYIKKIKNRVLFLNRILKQKHNKLNMVHKMSFLVGHIIKVHFLKSNTFTQITNSSGTLKVTCSAGNLLYKGKNKKARTLVLKNLTNSLLRRIPFLKNKVWYCI